MRAPLTGIAAALALTGLAGCMDPGPQAPDTSIAEASCLSAVGSRTGDAGVNLERTDLGDPDVVVFVNAPATDAIWICDAALNGTVYNVRDGSIRL